MALVFNVFILTLNLHCLMTSYESTDIGEQKFESIFDFLDELKNSTDDIIEFVMKMQTIFCPEQPICSKDGIQKRDKILNTLPSAVNIENKTIRMTDAQAFMGVCCLPCSCSNSCKQDGNCCMSKFMVMNDTNSAEQTKSECIIPSIHSYEDKEIPQPTKYNTGFLMITQCFEGKVNESIYEKCQNPTYKETGPVTSLRSGLTYWNEHCAVCNNDAEKVIQWKSIAKLDFNIVYFANESRFLKYPETLEELHQLIASVGDITYTPPVSMDNKICFRPKLLRRCLREQKDLLSNGKRWLFDMCQMFYNPVTGFIYQHFYKAYMNIFCFFCVESVIYDQKLSDCDYLTNTKDQGQIIALLDYRRNVKGTAISDLLELNEKVCSCNEIYDFYLDLCRPVFCPAGDFLVGCECVQPMKNMSGLPVLLALKVVPVKVQQSLSKDRENVPQILQTYNIALKAILENTFDHIKTGIAATFKRETDDVQYYISLTKVLVNSGYDTKCVIKPFLKYLDSERHLVFQSDGTKFSVKLTSRIALWPEAYPKRNTTEFIFKIRELGMANTDLTLVHIPNKKYLAEPYQIFSPLLFCVQVQLNETEFLEADGFIIIKNISPKVSIPYYYRVSASQVRVCAEHYLQRQTNEGAVTDIFSCTFGVYIYVVLGIFWLQ